MLAVNAAGMASSPPRTPWRRRTRGRDELHEEADHADGAIEEPHEPGEVVDVGVGREGDRHELVVADREDREEEEGQGATVRA